MQEKRFISVADYAKLYRISKVTILRRIKEGGLVAHKEGGVLRIPVSVSVLQQFAPHLLAGE